MPTFEVELSDGSKVQFEADRAPTEQELVEQFKSMSKGPQVSALKTAVEHGLSGVGPGAAFTLAFPAGAELGAFVPHPLGKAIVGGIGGIAAGTWAAMKAAKAQKQLLEATVPEFARKFEQELQVGEQQHPVAAIAGDVLSMAPSAKMAPFKLATLPFRAGLGATVGAGLPIVTEGRAPTWRDVAAGAATGAIYGEGRFNPFQKAPIPPGLPRATRPIETVRQLPGQRAPQGGRVLPQVPRAEAVDLPLETEGGEVTGALESGTTPSVRPVRPQPGEGAGEVPAEGASTENGERGGQRQAQTEAQIDLLSGQISDEEFTRLEREAIDAGEALGSPVSSVDKFTGETGNQPFARQFMRPGGNGVELRRRNFRSWLATVPAEQRPAAVRSRVLEEHIHRHTPRSLAEQFWGTLSRLEQGIETRHYTGEWSRAKYLDKSGVGLSDAQMGWEAMRRRMQKIMTGTTSEIAEAALAEKWKLKTFDLLGDAVRNLRELGGTKASKAGLAALSEVEGKLDAARRAVAAQRGELEPGEEAPAALQKTLEPTPDHFTPEDDKLVSRGNPKPSLGEPYFKAAGDRVKDPDFWVDVLERQTKGNLYGQEMAYQAGAFLRGLGEEGARPVIDAMEQARERVWQEARTLMRTGDEAKMSRGMVLAGVVQFPREAIEAARDTGSAKGIVPESRGKPLEMPEEQPAAIQKKLKPDVLTDQMAFQPPKPGEQVERSGFGAPVAAVIDKAASDTAKQAFAAPQIQVPDFDAYLGQMQSKYGAGFTKEKAFWPWLDTLQRQLMSLPGERIRDLLSKLDLYKDVAEALDPSERTPFLRRIPDAPEGSTQSAADAAQMAFTEVVGDPEKWKQRARAKGKEFTPEQQRRLAALGAIYSELAKRAGGRPKGETTRTTVGPEDIAQRFVVLTPGKPGMEQSTSHGEFTPSEHDWQRQFRKLTPEQAADPKAVGEAVTAEARASGEKVSLTKGLLAVMDKVNNRVLLLGSWRDGRRGPVVTNPTGAGDALKINDAFVKRYEPTHIITLREPVEDFRQVFESPEAFGKWFGDVDVEGTRGIKTSSMVGGGRQFQRGAKWQYERPEGMAAPASPQIPPFAEREGIPPAIPAAPTKTGRELRVPTFARRGVPVAPLPVGEPGRPAPAQILPPEAVGQIEQRAAQEHPYQPTPITPPSQELESRGIRLSPSARGERVPPAEGSYTFLRQRPPVKRPTTSPSKTPKPPEQPAAIQKMVEEASDLWKITVADITAAVSRRSVKQDIPRLLDGADSAGKQFALGARTAIENASMEPLPTTHTVQTATGTTTVELTGRPKRIARRAEVQEGEKRRRAAIAYISSGRRDNQGNWYAYKPYLDQWKLKLDMAEPKAEAWTKSINPMKRREGRRWLEAIKEMQGDVEYAREHWDDPAFRAGAHQFQKEIHDTIAFENAHGSTTEERDNYIPGLYEGAFWSDNLLTFGSKRLLGGQYRLPKKFKNPYDAILKGPYYLASRDIGKLAEHRIAAGHRIVERGLWMNALTGIMDPVSAQPVAKEPEFSKKLMTDPVTGNTWDKIVWKSPSPEYKLVQMPGKPIAVRLGYEGIVRSSTRPSVLTDIPFGSEALAATQILKHGVILLFDTFHPFRLGQYGLSIMGYKGMGWKGGYSALTYRAEELPRAVERGLISQKALDWAMTPVEVRLPSGESVTRTRKQIADFMVGQGLNVAKISDALYRDAVQALPIIGEPYHKLISPYNRLLFDRFIPGLMLESAVRNFEKYNKSHTGAGVRAITRDVVRDTNVFFGNMGRQGVFRSATLRDLAQLTLLAPMWQEGLLMKEAQFATRTAMLPARAMGAGFRKGLPAMGTTGAAMAAGLGAYIALTQMINLITRGKLTIQNPEKEHKLDAWIPTSDGKGIWISPMSVFAEVTHDFIRLGETKAKVWDRIVQMGENRLGPLGKMADILWTGRNPSGGYYSTSGAQLRGAAAQVTPFAGAVPITAAVPARAIGHKLFPEQVSPNPPGAFLRQLFASGVGIKANVSRSELARASEMARSWMESSEFKKETGWRQVLTDEPSYTRLRQAIRNGDDKSAKKILDALRKNRSDADIIKGMRMWAKRPLTGSQKAEREFIYSLSDKDLDTYSKANEERQATLEQFYDWMNKQP